MRYNKITNKNSKDFAIFFITTQIEQQVWRHRLSGEGSELKLREQVSSFSLSMSLEVEQKARYFLLPGHTECYFDVVL